MSVKVSTATKEVYKEDGSFKNLTVSLPGLGVTILNDQIEKDSFSLNESILSGSDLEFVGCIASNMQITIYGNNNILKNQLIKVSIVSEGTDVIPLFTGYVDSIKTELESTKKVITAYDAIYTKLADKNIADFYNSAPFPVTLGEFRKALFKYLGIDQVSTTLVNDELPLNKEYEPVELNALDVIKSICQLNGVFGKINRNGQFEYKKVSSKHSIGLFPGVDTFPGTSVFPGATSGEEAVYLGYYENLYFEEFTVNNIEKVTLRTDSEDPGVTYGGGTNNYIVENNMFAYNLPEEYLQILARNIYENIKDFNYTPFECDMTGIPYLEPGDIISLMVVDGRNDTIVYKDFTVMTRKFKGVQYLQDNYVAEGIENQKVFISNLNTRIENIQKSVEDLEEEIEDNYYDKDEIDEKLNEIETGFAIKSVEETPSDPDEKTLYLIQGECFVE